MSIISISRFDGQNFASAREGMSEVDTIIVVGDYNLPRLSWETDDDINALLPSNASSEQEVVLVETMVASGLHQINSLKNTNGRILDLAFVNEPGDVELIKPPAPLLRIDNHHMPFVLRINAEDYQSQYVMDSNQTTIDYDFRHCNFADLNRVVLCEAQAGQFGFASSD